MPAAVTSANVEEVIHWCIANDDMHTFYQSPAWERLRSEVMKEQHNECQMCKQRGFYRRATIVHHEQYVRKHPQLALSKTYTDRLGIERRQLVAVCTECHRQIHNSDKEHTPRYTNEERWD